MNRRQRERLVRAQEQDIVMLTALDPTGSTGSTGSTPDRWSVRGTQGTQYTVQMDEAGRLECDCMDARLNRGRLLCKHCCFVLIHVFGIDELEPAVRAGGPPAECIQAAARQTVQRRNPECAICTEAVAVAAVACVRCRNAYHLGCIERWLAVKATCPMCRESLGHRTLGDVR